MRRAALFLLLAGCKATSTPAADWTTTGGAPGNARYSPLDQINVTNITQLQVAWVYHTGDLPPDGHGEIQATPIVVDGVLYATTPKLAVIALRADAGTLLWRFDAFPNRPTQPHVNRGVVYWEGRVFFAVERRLYALDARTGEPIRSFGDSGWVDLGAGLGQEVGDRYLVSTSPGVVYKDVLIWGTRVGEEAGSAPGHVRAYDARTGKIRWTFHTIPWLGEFGYDTWPAEAFKTAGGANSWPGMTVDTARGIVYVPTGSATPDFYGGDRAGANLFANSLLALDATTGKRLWHFQTVHHDLWDRDLPAAPNLVTVTRDSTRVDAIAQITKSGFVFLFDRASGKPLFPIEERAVPASDLKGEQAWPTQPFPVKPAPFARQTLQESDVTPSERRRFRLLRHGSLFMPPSRAGTVVLPGFDGGGEWGGAAVDPETATLYVNGSDVPWIAAMRETHAASAPRLGVRTGVAIYKTECASCHGADRRGRDRAPSLIGVNSRLTVEQLQGSHRTNVAPRSRTCWVRPNAIRVYQPLHRYRRRTNSSATNAGETRAASRLSSHPGARSARSTSTRANTAGGFRSASSPRSRRVASPSQERSSMAGRSSRVEVLSSSRRRRTRSCARSTRARAGCCGKRCSPRPATPLPVHSPCTANNSSLWPRAEVN